MATATMGELLYRCMERHGAVMGERPTDIEQPEGEPTDEVVEPAESGSAVDLSGDRSGAAPWPSALGPGNFEHRRLISAARRALFGRGRELRIGRYRVERRLGAGGMGEVYLAADEALDRRVAIKRVLGTSTQEHHQERLRREARALARLSHPHVVQVYEVGEHEGRTFVAMEYIDGQTLARWLEDQPPWRAVLDVFVRAGRGLAAAHRAGLVHRDFKPDNVLLGRDGRVRVADFGLVLAGEPRTTEEAVGPAGGPGSMSVTGPFRGTIRYMPLEQLLGGRVDARSDQFAFCVALYEALWGMPPFSLDSSVARLDQLQDGEPTPPRSQRGRRVPRALWRVVRRGLSVDPSARWPDMEALLDALEGVARRRRRLAWAGAMAAVVGVAGLALGDSEPESQPCAAIDRELEGTWDDERRARLDAQLDALTVSHAPGSHQRVVEGLDRWAEGWVDQRTRVCHDATEQRVEPELGRLRNACLTRQRWHVEDLVVLLVEPRPDGQTLARAVEAVAALPPASACDGELALLGVQPPPPAQRDAVEAVRRRLGRAHQLRRLGRVEEGLLQAEHGERAARALGYGPLLAEAQAERARAELSAGSLARGVELLQEAIDTAESSRHDHLAAELWTTLALHTVLELHDQEAGSRRLRRAKAANGRVETSARMRGRLALARGQLAELRGDLGAAERSYRVALVEAEPGTEAGIDRASYLSNLADVVIQRDPDEGVALYRAAVEAAEQSHGLRHPYTANQVYILAIVLRNRDPQHPELAELLTRAITLWTESHHRPHRELAKAELLLATLALQRGELTQAEAHARNLVSIQGTRAPDDPGLRAETAHLLAMIHGIRAEPERALEQLRIALAIWEATDGPDAPHVLRLRTDAAAMVLSLGRLDEASGQLDALLPRVHGTPLEVPVRLNRAEVAVRQGRLRAASAELRALDTTEDLGEHRFGHALLDALIELRRGGAQSAALRRLHEARQTMPLLPQQVEQWLDDLELAPAERRALALDR